MSKAPFAYYGGKAGMAERIVATMPPHRVYIEPFFGSGAVFFAKPPVRHEIINDIDDAIVTFFRVLRDSPGELERLCRLTPHARTEYLGAELGPHMADVERARSFWVRVNQSFAKTAGTKTGWSVTTGRTQAVPATIAGRVARFEACAARLARASIECCDAVSLIARLGASDAVVYVDPPYLGATRRGRRYRDEQKPHGDYRHDFHGDEDHRRLAEVLMKTDAVVLLSGYPSELYDKLYADWWRREFQVTVHSSRAAGAGSRSSRVEVLWSNRDLDSGRLDFSA